MLSATLLIASLALLPAQSTRVPLHQTVDLDIGESVTVTLGDGSTAAVRVLDVEESRDAFRSA